MFLTALVIREKLGMGYRLPDEYGEGLDEVVAEVIYWFDRESRNWVIQAVNANGTQVGDADFTGTRLEAKKVAQNLAETHEVRSRRD